MVNKFCFYFLPSREEVWGVLECINTVYQKSIHVGDCHTPLPLSRGEYDLIIFEIVSACQRALPKSGCSVPTMQRT